MNRSLSSFFSIAVLVQLSACTPAIQPNNPNTLQTATPDSPLLTEAQVFKGALSKRDLEVSAVSNSSGVESSNSPAPEAAPTPAPSSAPSSANDISTPAPPPDYVPSYSPSYAPGYGYSSPGYGYFPGGDFSTYIPLRAEELKYAGNAATDLQTVYRQTLTPMLQEWDEQARLLEARGNTRPDQPEYIHLPGENSSSLRQFKAHWVFRFASSSRKETLSVYLNAEETLAYRTVYGEPSLALQKATITSDKALEIAKAAFKSERNISNDNGGNGVEPNLPMQMPTPMPMPPETSTPQNLRVFYDLPQELNWRTALVQQGEKLIYTFSFDWQTTRTALGLSKPIIPPPPTQTPSPFVTPTPGDLTYYCAESYVDNRVHLSGYVAIDALSGKVLVLNRPSYYDRLASGYNPGCSYGTSYREGYVGEPYPQPSAMPTSGI